MSIAGNKLLELIDTMTPQNADAVVREAQELRPHLDESERDYLQMLHTKRQALTGQPLVSE